MPISFDYFCILLLICAISYLCGSISTAIITCKVMGLPDPRSLGSGNPGATNVLRTGSKLGALITLLGDAVKALLPLLIVKYVLQKNGMEWQLPTALAGLSAFIGHIYSIFLQFKGGKGIATAYGMLLGLSVPTFSACALTWILVALIFRYSALAGLTAFALAPIYMMYFSDRIDWLLVTIIVTVLIFIRHKKNITNLLVGKESKIGQKTKPK